MKKSALFLYCIFLCVHPTWASESCFIAQENGQTLQSEGDCKTQYAPQSTFKIALSLIGFDSGIFESESKPAWTLPIDVDPYINICKGTHNPRTWIRDSCLWYSRILTTKLGMEHFQTYINKFDYGNRDLSGGLTDSWISSSLKISPLEQTEFLQRIVEHKLGISKESYEKTKNIMFVQELAGGWKLYGKTGNGSKIDKHGNKTDLQQGWFVGYIEKNNRHILFASHIVDSEKNSVFASLRAKNEALIKLWYLIDKIEQ